MGILAAFCILAMAVHLIGLAITVARSSRRREPSVLTRTAPPVTLLRPVCGLENNIEETLGSTYDLDYPDYEVIFCVASPSDPVIPLVERLIAANPDRPSQLLVGDDRISINPKLNNLVKGWHAARYDWIFMIDSNVLMPPDFVRRCTDRWDGETGLVCSPPVGIAPDGFFAELECAWLNSFQARWQLAADAFGLGFAQGKTMVWRRDILEAAGGIERLAAEVAEDAASTKIVRGAGLKVRLVDVPFPQPLGRRTFGEVWRRQLRWARLRRASFPHFFAPEILAGGAVPIACAVGLAATDLVSVWAAIAYVAVWYGAELAATWAVDWPSSRRTLPAMIIRDLLLPILYGAAFAGNGFTWRGNAMKIAADPDRPSRVQRVRRRVIDRLRAITADRRP